MSDEKKFTKGSWRIGKGNSVVADYPTSDKKTSGHDCIGFYEGHLVCESVFYKSNARLIAASPDLLEALLQFKTTCFCNCEAENGGHTERCKIAMLAINRATEDIEIHYMYHPESESHYTICGDLSDRDINHRDSHEVTKEQYLELIKKKTPGAAHHHEKIKCPTCGSIEDGVVLHLTPFDSYVHHCGNCGYIIMESEWVIYKDGE